MIKKKMMAWAKAEAKKETEAFNNKSIPLPLSLSQKAIINKDEERYFNVGYLFFCSNFAQSCALITYAEKSRNAINLSMI
jgi:hypothetical protein